MRRPLTIAIVVTTLGLGTAAWAEVDCTVPMADWQPRAAVQDMAEEQGWTLRRIKIDDGCYELRGRDGNGREIEVKVDPATLKVLEIEYDD